MVLSTTYKMPRARHSSPMRARSAICVRGLAMVSTKTMRVAGVKAASTLATAVASTKETSTPCPATVFHKLLVLPNKKDEETTWSPALSKACASAPIAAMPVAKHRVATPSSMRLILSSSADTVGLPWRP